MKAEWKGALVGGIIGGLVGVLLGIFVIIGISIASPHPETTGVALVGFLIALLIFILSGLVIGYYHKKYKLFFIISLVGIILQILMLLITFNINIQNKILYWLSYPGLILIVFLVLGIIIQKIKK